MFRRQLLAAIVVTFCVSLCANFALAQPNKSKNSKPATTEADDEAAQRRAVAISLVTTLADEARSFKDQTR